MNTRDLKYLIALADNCHFGKAAQACFVSQPALSMQIKKLEESLGIKLLERTNKSVLLTDIGMVIAQRARLILTQVNEIREIAKLAKDPFSSELKIGIIPTLAPYLLPHIIPKLSKVFPKLSIYLVEEQTALLIEKLAHGKLDAAFLALPVEERNLTTSLLFQEEFLLALPPIHPLTKRKMIRQNDLIEKHLLLLEEGHCMREQTLTLCHQMRAHETRNFRATSLETLRHMVSAGVGITLMPSLACRPQSGIAYIPFNAPKPERTIVIAFRKTTAKHALFETLTDEIRKILSTLKQITVLD